MDMCMRTLSSQIIKLWPTQKLMEELLRFIIKDSTLLLNQSASTKTLKASKLNSICLTSGLSEDQDHALKSFKQLNHYLLDKECLMLSTHLCWEELALFQELSDVERLVFLRLCPSTLTASALFTSVAVREETKWLRCWMSSQSSK